MISRIWLVVLLVLNFSAIGQTKKKVCFSIDDLPVVSYGEKSPEFHFDLTEKLLHNLSLKKVQAIGFVNEGKLFDKDEELISFQKECLQKWIEAGMDLGNHTLNHKDYNTTAFEEYAEEILIGEQVTKQLLSKKSKELKYFRHPFLHTGYTKELSDSLDSFLSKHGYIVSPVTIDNSDYLFAKAYHLSIRKGDNVMAKKIAKDYLVYMEEKLLYFERQSFELFNRNINQILLIHASLLNAEYVDDLADIYIKHGYTFVSMDEILEDPVYKTPITKFGKYGISWIDRWALSAGKKGDFFKDDPVTPQYIENF